VTSQALRVEVISQPPDLSNDYQVRWEPLA